MSMRMTIIKLYRANCACVHDSSFTTSLRTSDGCRSSSFDSEDESSDEDGVSATPASLRKCGWYRSQIQDRLMRDRHTHGNIGSNTSGSTLSMVENSNSADSVERKG